jgi:hypothetical protein
MKASGVYGLLILDKLAVVVWIFRLSYSFFWSMGLDIGHLLDHVER